MREHEIRSTLLRNLDTQHRGDPDTLVIEELGLCQGIARVDVAVVNGLLHGYEIKSPDDTLERLPAQEAVYSRLLNRVTVVTSGIHLAKLEAMIPSWWGITVATPADNADVSFEEQRPASANPGVDGYALAQLLWRDEALALLEELQLDRGFRSKTREVLWHRLVDCLPLDFLAARVRETLRTRQGWRSAPPPR